MAASVGHGTPRGVRAPMREGPRGGGCLRRQRRRVVTRASPRPARRAADDRRSFASGHARLSQAVEIVAVELEPTTVTPSPITPLTGAPMSSAQGPHLLPKSPPPKMRGQGASRVVARDSNLYEA